jgi:ribonuclease VapC
LIAVDTSALMAIVQNEPAAERCIFAIESSDRLLISAATMAEALIVSARRNVAAEMESIFDRLAFEIVLVSPAFARDVAAAYDRWGRGVHPAALNFGDCFAYALAKSNDCPLLYIGNDFAKTDIVSAITP